MVSPNLQRAARAPASGISETAIKIATAVALLRSKQQSFRKPQLPPTSASLADLTCRTQHWKRKAKDRKQEIWRLINRLKDLEDDANAAATYPDTAACECYFFSDLGKLNSTPFGDGSDCALRDVLRRRFIRQVRAKERRKRRVNGSIQPQRFLECSVEDEMEMLKLSVDFLVDLCSTPGLMDGATFSHWAHQAVNFMHGSINSILSMEKNMEIVEDTIDDLVVRMVRRLCGPAEEGILDPESGRELDVQHIIRKLGTASTIGQRVILCVSQRISEVADNLMFLDPFDSRFPDLHNSMFVMIQLIEFMVSDYLHDWAEEKCFNNSLFEDWVGSFGRARKSLELLESRSGLYIMYMDRVAGEFARQVGRAPILLKLNADIVHSIFQQ